MDKKHEQKNSAEFSKHRKQTEGNGWLSRFSVNSIGNFLSRLPAWLAVTVSKCESICMRKGRKNVVALLLQKVQQEKSTSLLGKGVGCGLTVLRRRTEHLVAKQQCYAHMG